MRILLKVGLYLVLPVALYLVGGHFGEAFEQASSGPTGAAASRAVALFLSYLVLGAALGLLVAWDMSRLLGRQPERVILGVGRAFVLDPRLRAAQRCRKDGDPLEAIRQIRAYLADKPRDWQVWVRIAELYEHDLQNPLAGALEYEEILKRRVPKAARAWLTLRLANNYLVLRRGDEAVELLQRVVTHFPRSPAAAKARRRLAIYEQALAQAGAQDATTESAAPPAPDDTP